MQTSDGYKEQRSSGKRVTVLKCYGYSPKEKEQHVCQVVAPCTYCKRLVLHRSLPVKLRYYKGPTMVDDRQWIWSAETYFLCENCWVNLGGRFKYVERNRAVRKRQIRERRRVPGPYHL